MNSFAAKNGLFICNIIIVHLLVACFAILLADFRQNYQGSLQQSNANKFSRVISLGIAYQTKQNFTLK
jgi:hypothetical protein